MARKKKINLTPEEELEQVLSEIDQTKDTLKALEKTRKELEAKVKMDRLAALDDLISESGKSYDEVEELLRN
ncbi:MAG: hypothetical protein OSJ69_11500 [Acetatifactor sp.]|nr:hypothetical protein [Acetatifactor sp.]